MVRATRCSALAGNPPWVACSRTRSSLDVDAEELVSGDIAVEPLDVDPEVGEHVVALLADLR